MKKNSQRVGILSGTFDPVHFGHLQFAQQALEECNLDIIFFLVEPRPRRKQGVKAFEHRVRMVQLALKQHPNIGDIVLEQARFTVNETLPILENRFKNCQLFLLMGDDVLAHLVNWPHIDRLMNAVHFIIGAREQTRRELDKTLATIQVSRGVRFTYTIIHTKYRTVSSKRVRAALRKGETPPEIPLSVANYIAREGLYSSSKFSAK